jgi:phosphatidylglycerol:prolipoprotein diacylglycerol transferase
VLQRLLEAVNLKEVNFMIPYEKIEVLNLGFIDIKIWGLLVSLGFILAILLIIKEAEKRKLELENIYDLCFWILVGAIVGGRLFYVLFNLSGIDGFFDIFKIWEGGMSFFGGFIFAILFSYIYLKKKKLNFWKYSDLVIPYVALGYAVGRIGCYLIGDHLGKITNVAWGIFYGGALRHPVALYHILLGLGLFVVLYKLRGKYFDGFLTILFVLVYGVFRFFLDFLRIEPLYSGLTDGQYLSIVFVVIGITLLLMKKFKSKKKFKINNVKRRKLQR